MILARYAGRYARARAEIELKKERDREKRKKKHSGGMRVIPFGMYRMPEKYCHRV
jgi:hypothetical protein